MLIAHQYIITTLFLNPVQYGNLGQSRLKTVDLRWTFDIRITSEVFRKRAIENKAHKRRMLNKAVGFVLLDFPQQSRACTPQYKACKLLFPSLSQMEQKNWTQRKILHLNLYCACRSYMSHTGFVLSCGRHSFYLFFQFNWFPIFLKCYLSFSQYDTSSFWVFCSCLSPDLNIHNSSFNK